MLEPSFGDIGDGASGRFPELAFKRDKVGADLLGVRFVPRTVRVR
jgi:hypothetical protein